MATQYPGWLAGQRITAQRISDSLPQFVYKTGNTDRASTTTLTNDPDLHFAVAANAIYIVEWCLLVASTTAAGGVKVQWSVPAAADGLRAVTGPSSSATSDNNITMRSGVHNFSTLNISYGGRNSATSLQHVMESGTLFTTTAGTVAIQWAQVSSNSTACRMGLGSWGRCTRVG